MVVQTTVHRELTPLESARRARKARLRLAVIRIVIVLAAASGLNYITWRWLASVNWEAWWIAVPLVIAETYSLIDSLIFGLGAWRLRERPDSPPITRPMTVDVLVATYNEPFDLVMKTAIAARDITYPHETWILDDGNRPELRRIAEEAGIGVITRSEAWDDRPRHAKAGRVALVQTPQWFVNVPKADPLGSQAELFYGPIQQSKDGWNAAFFCGSNALLRREALMQLGVSRYVGEITVAVNRGVRSSRRILARARREYGSEPRVAAALDHVAAALDQLKSGIARGDALADVTYAFQRRMELVRQELVGQDIADVRAELAELADLAGDFGDLGALAEIDDDALSALGDRSLSPLAAVESISMLISSFDVGREEEAQAIMPLATISVTEDMATSMRLHGLGWRSVYHDEVLAKGLAPEDLPTMLTQRLRWAQGTMQVLFRENPLVQKGLSWGQRIMYFGTMWSYFAGFAGVVYIAAPVLYLSFGVMPVQAWSVDFFARFLPFFAINQLLFAVVANGRPTWRGAQYSLALFPVWIKSVTTAFGNVYRGRSLTFSVTPKTKNLDDRPRWDLVRPQLFAIAALIVSLIIVGIRYVAGQAEGIAPLVNVVWVIYDLAVFSIIIRAVLYTAPTDLELKEN
ncbi:MAG: cellulose synthase [Microbacterium sp.]|nr:cellulose synthase [Microbacterium sp.]